MKKPGLRNFMATTASHNDASYGLDQPHAADHLDEGRDQDHRSFAFVAKVLAVVVTANFYDGDGTNGDPFGATTAMRFVVYLTIGLQP